MQLDCCKTQYTDADFYDMFCDIDEKLTKCLNDIPGAVFRIRIDIYGWKRRNGRNIIDRKPHTKILDGFNEIVKLYNECVNSPKPPQKPYTKEDLYKGDVDTPCKADMPKAQNDLPNHPACKEWARKQIALKKEIINFIERWRQNTCKNSQKGTKDPFPLPNIVVTGICAQPGFGGRRKPPEGIGHYGPNPDNFKV